MSCGMGLIKYLIFIFNFIFALCGLALLVIGVLMHIESNTYQDAVKENMGFPSVTLIVIGSIIFIIAFFGCCGAIRESHCMTITFASFLLTILIIQVAVAIYVFVAFKESNINVRSVYKDVFDKYWTSETSRDIVNTVQKSFDCCGIDSPNDFYNMGNKTVPWSCCANAAVGESCAADIYPKGCVDQLKQFVHKSGMVLGGVALGIAGVEFIGIVFALCLANSIKRIERRHY